jgi:hypothetical protein
MIRGPNNSNTTNLTVEAFVYSEITSGLHSGRMICPLATIFYYTKMVTSKWVSTTRQRKAEEGKNVQRTTKVALRGSVTIE